MHCKELVKGKKWVCVADGPSHPVTGKRRQVSRSAKGKGEAIKKVEQAVKELESAIVYHKDITVREYSREWYQQYLRRGRKETTNGIREEDATTLNGFMGSLEIKAVTPKGYQNFLNYLFDKGYALNTIKRIHSTGRMIFKKALEDKAIDADPTTNVFIPRKKITVEEIENDTVKDMYLEVEELKLFLVEVDKYVNFVYVALIYLLTFSGMRPGEAAALHKKDVLFESSQVRITKTLQYGKKGENKIIPPKTMTAVRTVDLDKKIMSMLQQLIDYKKEVGYPESEFLFAMSDGHPPTVPLIRNVVKRIAKRAGIKKMMNSYILRHTHISLLAEAGADLPHIMQRVGHKNESTTTEVYLHTTKGVRDSLTSKMSDRFGDLMSSKRNGE
ncbi:tyrosine-type recombinase/integrase [Sporosarcina sp. FSL K6-1508]|uniref:tyrosine-type recombinase/integrase n=1 Tax=Sporosarcina sp. FSL K6-1508 TaxID=2921553 RepID=UPI0030F6C383